MSGTSRISPDYVSDVLDEIALEGLDGITIEALWKRLSARQNFCLKIDSNSKNFLWNLVLRMTDVKFYELPQARESIKHYNYTSLSDSQSACLELDEIYPYTRLKNVSGVLGSCQYYSSRIDITEEVHKIGLKEAEEKWGNKLVIVASQDVRCSALLGNFCSLNIDFTKSTIHYDILERLGRSRYLGLATCGKASIQSVVEDPKSVFHYLKVLLSHKLIRKQAMPGTTKANPSASKVHLTRFFEECLNENMSILQTAIEELKKRPNYAMPTEEFYELFDARKKARLKKFKKSATFKKFLTISKILPYRTFFPDASQSDWERKSKNGERIIRCVQLVNPDIELADIFDKDCDPDDEESPAGFLPRGIYFPNMPIVSQAFYHIRNSEASGMTQNELTQKMGLSRKFIRALIKRLSAEKHCKFFIENDGRRRSKRYIVGENVQTKAAASEIVQILCETAAVPQGTSDKTEKPRESEDNSKPGEKIHQISDENVSYRTLRRIGMIMKLIKIHRFRLFYQITKHINEEEIKEGVTSRVDRGTVKRILEKLEKDGLLKIITLSISEKSGHTVKLYTDPTFEPDEKQMENLYHINTSSYNGPERLKGADEKNINLEHEFSNVLLENLAEMKKMLQGINQKVQKTGQVEVKECELVYSPKFIRLNILHDLVFHLVYDYTGMTGLNQQDMLAELSKTAAIEEDLKNEMPKLYATQLSSYMFVPPLNHSGKMPGWFLISDIMIRMPLSVLVKIIKVSETCPELWTYLHHPIRRHFLIKDLPLEIRQLFFNRKNHMSSLFYEFKRLCFIGLLQFGPKFGREIYQTFAYLNRKASLLDTSKSPAGYYHVSSDMEFDRKSYYFETKDDVKKYWMDMFDICLGTNLGVKTNIIKKEILSERELGREPLKKIIEPKSVEKVMEDDNGHLPGDHLGAAGLDSAMFSFLRSNWTVPIKKSKEEVKKQRSVKVFLQRIKKEHIKKTLLLKRNRRKKGPLKTEGVNPSSVAEDKSKFGKLRKAKDRECRFQRRKEPSYDEIDLEALKYMNTLRVTWSTSEDNLLLICRVAMLYLCPNARTFVRIPWVEVRRVLQENCPESRNKTQRAIARRVVYMLKNPTTIRSVNLCLEELKELPEARARFDCSEFLDNIKPSTPNLSNLQNELYKKFHELVAFLKDRILESTNFNIPKVDKDLIPDTINEFLDKYQFDSEPEVPVTVKSIRENVIRAILMSSLSCRADKTSSAAQLFDIYRQYNDDELQNAVKNLYNDKVITFTRKVGNPVFKSGKILPLSFTPYKLSFAFRSLLNMKFAHSVYSDSFSQINKLIDHGNEELEVDLNECNVALFLLASRGFISFRTIIPEQIIILDAGNFSDATYSKMLRRYCEMLRFSGTNLKVVCSSGKIITRSEEGEPQRVATGEKRNLQDSDELSAKKPKLNEEPEKDTEQESSRTVGESGTGENATELNQTISEREQISSKTTKSSRVILYMMREEAKKEANNDFAKMAQEFYVVNASKVLSSLHGNALEQYSKDNGFKAAAVITKQITSRASVPINLVNENEILGNFKEDTVGVKQTLDFISSKKEMGATAKDLNLNCARTNLCTILRYLLDMKIVIKVGITETRFVSQNYCNPWLLNSFKMTRLEREKLKPKDVSAVTLEKSKENESDGDEVARKKIKGVVSLEEIKSDDYVPPACSTDVNNKVKVIIRPWIRIDGSLNRKVLDRFLGTVLAHIMVNPGITITAVMKKFSPSFTPVWTKDLIEILFDIGCVTFTTLVVLEKSNLFSKSVVRVSDCYTGLEEDCYVAVEAKVDAITTLGLFIGKTTYTKDFLLD